MQHQWVLACLLLAIATGASGATEVPSVTGPVPVTASSQPYGAAMVAGAPGSFDLAAVGYLEEEFFISGRANVYAYDADFKLLTAKEPVTYTTRMLVRRPVKARRFSGIVILESAHPLMGGGSGWLAARRYLLDHGDAYVLLTTGDDALTRGAPLAPERATLATQLQASPSGALGAIEALRRVNAARYAPLQWPDDDAPRWDAFAQAAALLKANQRGGPMGELKVRRIYAQGWSFTGSLLRTFINEGFHERARDAAGAPLIDGYLIGISAAAYVSGMVSLTTGAPVLPVRHARRITRGVDVPVIELLTENEAITNLGPQPVDADRGIGRHRIYEVPGLTHGDGLAPPGETPTSRYQLAQAGIAAGTGAAGQCPLETSDVPMRDLASAALANLEAWVTRDDPPPPSARITMQAGTGQPVRDRFGNAQGGVRMPQVEVPLARYGLPSPESSAACRNDPSPFLKVRRQPLSGAELASLYDGPDAYLKRFRTQLKALTSERWLLEADADRELADARGRAAAAFK